MPAKVSLLLTVWVRHSRDIRPIGEDLEKATVTFSRVRVAVGNPLSFDE
jgi:hypothetical protein